MRNLILTIQIRPENDLIARAYDASAALKARYAMRIGADLMFKTSKTLGHLSGWPSPERLEMYDLFDRYDRILYLDADILIRPDAPDFFKQFPAGYIYMLNECPDPVFNDSYNTNIDYIKETVRPCIQGYRPDYQVSEFYPYCNAGVLLCDRKHREIFNTEYNEYFEHYRFEQDFLNYNIWKQKQEWKPLPIEYNGIWLFQKDKENYLDKNFFIHYIGIEPKTKMAETMLADFEKLEAIK